MKNKKMMIIFVIIFGTIIGYLCFHKNKKYYQLKRDIKPECIDPKNCPTCPYYDDCFGLEVNI